MKKILLFIVFIGGMLSASNLKSQTFSTEADTVWQNVSGTSTITATVVDYITNLTGGTLKMQWHVSASSFPSDWLDSNVLSICDDQNCIQNNNGEQLWNGTGGQLFGASYFANSAHDSIGDFHLQLSLGSAVSNGSYYMTVTLRDTTTGVVGAPTKNITFIVNRIATAVTNINNPVNDIVLYPNPAHDELNVVYDQTNDIKNIAVYNIIGKVVAVYKVTDSSGANLYLGNLLSGIYFVRLMNSHGDVVVTRKFTKQ